RTGRRLLRCDLQCPLAHAGHCCDGDAIRKACAWRLVAVEVDDRDVARLRLEALQRVETNPDADRNEGAEASVDACTERDPLVRRLRTQRRCNATPRGKECEHHQT